MLLAEMVTGDNYLLAGRAALSNSDWGGIDERKEGVDRKGSRGKSLEGQHLEGGCWGLHVQYRIETTETAREGV